MEARAAKGLLTDEEKLILATERAEAAGKKDENCVFM